MPTQNMNFKQEFEGKKITVLGLGLLGRGVGDVKYLAECGANLIVTDLKSQEDLKESLEKLSQFQNITYVLGEHRFEDFENRDLILVAAGVPMDSQYLAHARKNNVPLSMSAALFLKLSKIPVIGVTGTRGKSTVTHMIHHVLSESTEGGEILLGGNVRGVSNLELLSRVDEDTVAVFELDSWQLQGFGWEKVSPQISVFTNFMDDHANYYKGDRSAYFEDKAQIFLHQEPGNTLVTTHKVFEQIKEYALSKGLTLRQEIKLADASLVPEDVTLQIPGEHNRENAALAAEALRATGLSDEHIWQGLSTFRGVEGRLEFLREIQGVKIYNDNNATTPEATIAGLRALGDGKNIVLIIGGADKMLDADALLREIKKSVKQVVLLSGTGSETIQEKLENPVTTSSLQEAVDAAISYAENGDIVLFSPAFASFGLFKNEYDRNDQFIDIVRGL